MKTIKPIIFLIFLFISISSLQAQLMNKLKKAVGNTLEDHAVNAVNKGLSKALVRAEDKMWESMFGVKKSSMDSMVIANQNDPEAFEKMMGSLYGGATIPVDDEYTFESRLKYKMSSESGKKSNSMEYTVLINPDKDYMGTQMGSMESDGKKSSAPVNLTTIMDYGNNAMIMIMEDQKMAQIMPMNMVIPGDSALIVENNVTIEKTGKTKEILGYTCEEYQMKSDDADGSIWIAPDVPVMSQALFENMGKSSFAKNTDWLDTKGMMMEMDMMVNEEDSKKPSHMKMTVISMDEEKNAFSMADYQTMNFGNKK